MKAMHLKQMGSLRDIDIYDDVEPKQQFTVFAEYRPANDRTRRYVVWVGANETSDNETSDNVADAWCAAETEEEALAAGEELKALALLCLEVGE